MTKEREAAAVASGTVVVAGTVTAEWLLKVTPAHAHSFQFLLNEASAGVW
jgi:hypothetical protein